MQYQIGKQTFEADTEYLTLDLRDSSDLLGDGPALRQRLSDEGFLLIRGLHDRDEVLRARVEMLELLDQRGLLDRSHAIDEGVVNPAANLQATSSVRGNDFLKTDSVRAVVYGPRAMSFFATLFDEPALHFQFEWLRAVPPGGGSPIHCDRVYMGRGSQRLHTLWTPFGRLTPDMGTLAICLKSHQWDAVKETYGQDDVDRDRTGGVFTDNPAELVDHYGGQWATTTFEPGDAVVLDMYNLHASTKNESNRFRISCDSRFQPASESVDERWSGSSPKGHDVMWAPGTQLESIADSKLRWKLNL